MTLRARLTIWYSGLLAGVLLLFGTTVYLLVSFNMTRQIQEQLANTAEDIRSASMRTMRGIGFDPLALNLTANVHVQLWNREGDLLNPERALQAEPFDPLNLDTEVATYRTVEIDSLRYRVLTYPLVLQPEDRLVGHLQLASSLETVDRALDSMLFFMVVGGVLAVAAAGLVGWSTASAALRPLEQVTETALQITRADDLSRRIPMDGPPRGEVGRLTIAFNETLERLENLFETQRRFLADVSHELRTPLTSIQGNVDLMRRMDHVDEESLDAISGEVKRMTRMVQDLLLLAQAETGKLPLAQEIVEMDTLMLEVYNQARVLAPEGVGVRLGNEDQVQVLGDPDRLKQVLLNLVANALDHTPAGGQVTLGLKCVEDWARLTVSDTGSGIPPEDLPHIFERFYRVDRSRTRSQGGNGGAGLGLSIAYWIVRSHGGRIEVASEREQGTTFSVWLPRLTRNAGAGNQTHENRGVSRQKPYPESHRASSAERQSE